MPTLILFDLCLLKHSISQCYTTAFNKTDQSYILASLPKNMNLIDLGHTENEWSSKKKKRSVIIAYDILEK